MRKILLLIPAFICPVLTLCQTITPIYIENDSVDIEKIQFIDPKSGKAFRTETQGKFIDINDYYYDLNRITIIIPFKDGTKIIANSVETKYFGRCKIEILQNKNAKPACTQIDYWQADLGKGSTFDPNCCVEKHYNNMIIYSGAYNYYDLTKNLKLNTSKRLKLLRRNMKKRFPGQKIPRI